MIDWKTSLEDAVVVRWGVEDRQGKESRLANCGWTLLLDI